MTLWAQVITGNLFVACLIGGLAWCVGRTGRRARLAHTLWLIFFVKLITPPIVAFPLQVPAEWWPSTVGVASGSDRDAVLPVDPPLAIALSGTEDQGIAEANFTTTGAWRLPSSNGISKCFLVVWLSGFVWIVVRGLIRLIRFHRLLQQNGTPDEDASRFVRDLLQSENGRGVKGCSPQVLRLPLRVSPMLFGLGRRPVIVCPDQLWKSLSENERHAFLAHETAHYYRRDHWVRWLEWIVTATYWWFPAVYIARRQLERHEEACCDAWAVRKLNSAPRQYAEALLRVIDFISEYRVGIPRFASGMQPTYSLEERLHRVMKGSHTDGAGRSLRWSVSVSCFSLWLVHPVLQPYREPAVAVNETAEERAPDPHASFSSETLHTLLEPSVDSVDLPEPPQGFWNRKARRQWADFSLTLPGARLIAEASRGITLESPGRQPLRFSSEELSAVVEIPSTQRIVIGDALGRLRLWDLTAGMPVSLIGVHPTAVSSAAYHEVMGLASADESGSVMRWDLQSGQALATWADATAPVQSIRYANDGQTLAILVGHWAETSDVQSVYFVDSRSLQTKQTLSVPPHTAVVLQSPDSDWMAVDWSGSVRSLKAWQIIGVISKHQVSALVLCQESPIALPEHEEDH